MQKKWVIPDIHGCIKTLQALFEEQIRPNRHDEIYFLGDYIDRGPDSKSVLDYIMKLEKDRYNIFPLRGNHEDFVVELYEAETDGKTAWMNVFGNRKRSAWNAIGGRETLKSFKINSLRQMPVEYIDWMKKLEYFIQLDDFILVHAGLNFDNEDPFEDKRSMMWTRDYKIIPGKIGNRRIIHGHVPVNIEIIDLAVKNKFYKFVDIDNGPYISGQSGFGNLAALELTNMELVIQDNRDY